MLALAVYSLSFARPLESNIVDLAAATPDLSTLVTALKAADLVDTLSGPGPFTVFAPTNAAFSKLPEATLNALLEPKNKAALVDVLTYHVVAGRAIHAADFFAQQKVQTVDGKAVEVVKDKSGVHINNAAVTTADVGASNGVVHIIDAVLIPPGFVPPTPTTGCTGASAGLAADQCAAWGKFWDDAGGPNWGGRATGCSKSDPCGSCRYGYTVRCSGGSITEIDLQSSGITGTISNAIGAFVDMESFSVSGNRRLTGSLPASMSAWKKLKFFDVRGCKFDGAAPALNYGAMKTCYLLEAGFSTHPPTPDFSCPFPQGVTEKCEKFDGSMEYRPVTNADCRNTTASE